MIAKLASLVLAALLVRAHAASQSVASGSAVNKVIKMLEDMSATAKKEKNDEEVQFAKFSTWCGNEKPSLAAEIKKNGEQIELLQTATSKLDSDAKELGAAIAELQETVEAQVANKKAETAQREKDHADYLVESKDYEESVDALERAIYVLQKQNFDRGASEDALVQVSTRAELPEKAKSMVAAFLSMIKSKEAQISGGNGHIKLLQQAKQEPAELSYEAPEANAYEFQSGSIVDLLKKLKNEFSSKLGDCQKEEMNSKHAYDMIIQDLTDSIENAETDIENKKGEAQSKAEESAKKKKDMLAVTALKAENEKLLTATTAECSEKTLSFEEKQKLRAEELQAIAKAIEILSSPEVSENADTYLNLGQQKAAPSLAQAVVDRKSALVGQSEGIHRKLHDFLASESRRLKSKDLGLLAQSASVDPFGKVKQMIESMITRLTEEANEDAEHQGFCDTELGKSKVTRTKLSEEIDALQAAIEDGKSTITLLTDETAKLTKEVAELVKAMAESTDMREEEKATNAKTIKDAKAAKTAVQAAISVLEDFYKKASTATALMQAHRAQPKDKQWGLKKEVKMGSEEWNSLANPGSEGVDTGHKEGMQTFGDTYQGSQDAAGGVLALLEVVESDFGTLEADTSVAETEAENTYKAFMAESKKNKAVKDKKIRMNASDLAAARGKLTLDVADLKGAQDQLLAADRYYEKLVPQCIDQGMSWEEKTAARKAEIASLKEALAILSGEDIA